MFAFEFKEKSLLPQYEAEQEIPAWVENEARLINEALEKNTVTKEEAEFGLVEEREILEMMRKMVEVTYFVEYPSERIKPEERGEALSALFKQEFQDKDGTTKTLAEFLGENRHAVSLAMSTLDEPTAESVRYLNEKGVPVVGWVVVDDLEGYWTNPTNIKETEAKTQGIRDWAKENDLKLTALGFDLEKPIEYIRAVQRGNVREMLKQIRDYRSKKKERSQESDPKAQLERLIAGIRQEGMRTEAYTMPRFMKGILGGMDTKTVDRYVEMTYTSMLPEFARKKGLKAMRSKGAIPALGLVTGKEGETPGRELVGNAPLPHHLTQEELEHDLDEVLGQELNIKDRTFTLRNLYLFALNDARVALMMDQALRKSFGKKTSANFLEFLIWL